MNNSSQLNEPIELCHCQEWWMVIQCNAPDAIASLIGQNQFPPN
jgi:hypothetical protein